MINDQSDVEQIYTYACDYVRSLAKRRHEPSPMSLPVLSRFEASHIIKVIAKVLGVDEHTAFEKLACAYLEREASLK